MKDYIIIGGRCFVRAGLNKWPVDEAVPMVEMNTDLMDFVVKNGAVWCAPKEGIGG